LDDGRRIFVTGFVDDVRPYLQRATVVTSPLRFGAGMKNKLQAGLAMQKAMVVSSVTCEGFGDIVDGQHALIADDPGDFAAAVCSLLEDPARRHELGRRGSELIRSRYTWEAASGVLVDTLRRTPPARP
jgi:glycosyltransferase involved in cell wall biosynthesis